MRRPARLRPRCALGSSHTAARPRDRARWADARTPAALAGVHLALLAALAAPGLAACGAPAPPPAARPRSAAEHVEEARAHEAEAVALDEQEQRLDELGAACGDTVLQDQATSGGERLLLPRPCWSTSPGERLHRRRVAAQLRAHAARHRAAARALRAAERAACAGLPDDELDHTPFAHRGDLAAVDPVVDGDRVRGARIEFRPVAGLDAAWLSAAIACHRARAAALGWSPRLFGYDPTLLPGATSTVRQRGAAVEVDVRSPDTAEALAIYGRAVDLLAPSPER